jgi:hypothetical protein
MNQQQNGGKHGTSSSEVAIEVKNLNFSFSTSDGRKRPVLFDINLHVQHGSRLLLMFVYLMIATGFLHNHLQLTF